MNLEFWLLTSKNRSFLAWVTVTSSHANNFLLPFFLTGEEQRNDQIEPRVHDIHSHEAIQN